MKRCAYPCCLNIMGTLNSSLLATNFVLVHSYKVIYHLVFSWKRALASNLAPVTSRHWTPVLWLLPPKPFVTGCVMSLKFGDAAEGIVDAIWEGALDSIVASVAVTKNVADDDELSGRKASLGVS